MGKKAGTYYKNIYFFKKFIYQGMEESSISPYLEKREGSPSVHLFYGYTPLEAPISPHW